MFFLLFLLRGLFSDLRFFKDFQLYEIPYKIKKLKSFYPSTKPQLYQAIKVKQSNNVELNEINKREKGSLSSVQRRR
jgi:hypothetical protein